MLPDGDLRPDDVTSEDLSRYETVVLPHCHVLTPAQAAALSGYLGAGGSILYTGPLGSNLGAESSPVTEHERAVRVDSDAKLVEKLMARPQVSALDDLDAAINLQRTADGIAVHLLRYEYDESSDAVPVRDEVTIGLNLPGRYTLDGTFGAPKPPGGELAEQGEGYVLTLKEVPLYSVVSLKETT
jgi:hypothetical protein